MRPRHLVLGLAGLLAVGAAILIALAWYPAIRSVERPDPSSFDQALIARGAELALIGNCNVCHTKPGGEPYAGGLPLQTPFGTIFATNITPDVDTGIGRWSEQAFLRSMHQGVSRDGSHLYPAFPYDHFTKTSEDDVRAIYAFLMTRPAVHAQAPANELIFPLNFRPLIAGWKLLFFQPGRFEPDPGRSAELNRGAYLVDGLGHCGGCHTPRNALGAEKRGQYLAGGESNNWHAPALNAASPAPTPWTADQLVTYLRQGFVSPHGVAAGPMQPVVENLGGINEADVKAIAAYIGSILEPATADRPDAKQILAKSADRPVAFWRTPAVATTGGPAQQQGADGEMLYAGACALCHERTGLRFSVQGLPLALSKAVTMPDARNLIHVILHGIDPPTRAPASLMPGFASALTDEQVAALAAYLRSTFSDRPAWNDLQDQVRKVREQNDSS